MAPKKTTKTPPTTEAPPPPAVQVIQCQTCKYGIPYGADFTLNCTLVLPPHFLPTRRPIVNISQSCSLHTPRK
jgi:hypothetical protein